MPDFKIVLLGEGCVGKTSIVLRYCQNTFNESHITTIQAAYLSKTLTVNGDSVKLNIWDTAGQERFHALAPIYYRDANGALLTYDITDRESFTRVKNWVKELRKERDKDVQLVIAGNKCDRDSERVVTLKEAEDYAATIGAFHCSTSAKINKGIDELFIELSKKLLASRSLTSMSFGSSSSMMGGGAGNKIIIGADDTETPDGEAKPCSC
eukprot:CAMPEP_0184336986 /NCGR_PEP_ID=MMETSP1089-20130417/5291_1 /TAXON_ID=38269 ORGANISM="Gloeochaete wittrockiana, Strain SAG46.84" /NCGR_SAMPLE_ID=MMETSP1089 /ASSEMBLY_ACC=CAM_ASM_000445 /LENGTH=209 /DNA_ID=CAMNT_0026662331 /DNA_START=70 /DNA_END=699 /DNA_ORIENTATION=-